MSFWITPTSVPQNFSEKRAGKKTVSDYMWSSSVIALHHAIQERVSTCLYRSQKSGKAYFDELLGMLLYIPLGKNYSYSQETFETLYPEIAYHKNSGQFYFPEETLTKIRRELGTLSIFEKKVLFKHIEEASSRITPLYFHLKFAYSYLKRVLQISQQTDTKWVSISYFSGMTGGIVRSLGGDDVAEWIDHTWYSAEIIPLSEILAEAKERTRFQQAENTNPELTQKIQRYQERIEAGIWSLTDRNFSQVHDTLFRVTHTILTTRETPEFSPEELLTQIGQLSEFECQYFITALKKALFPEAYTSKIPRTKILRIIKEILEKQSIKCREKFSGERKQRE